MTHTAIRHMLSALTAVALVATFASSPALAQSSHTHDIWSNDVIIDVAPSTGATYNKPKTPKGLATKKGSQQTGGVQTFGIREASKNSQ